MCISTHYEGDPCDNTKKFYKWIREILKNKDEPEGKLFKGLKFSIFGLGDTSYEQYNAMGRYFDKTLEDLGGERVYKLGEGNAEKNQTEDHFNEWKQDLWRDLIKYYKSSETVEDEANRIKIVRENSLKVGDITQLPLSIELLSKDDDVIQ